MDNRPLRWEEFLERIGQTVYLSATPGPYELARGDGRRSSRSSGRPAWSTPRSWSSRPRARSTTWCTRSTSGPSADERVLVTTLTKKMSEDLTDYLLELGVRVRYLHSEVDTLRRVELLRELRHGRVRRAGRHQPAARGPRPARGVAGGDPRRRQGGLPALGDVADPDDRPRRPQRVRPGPHVRRQDHRLDGAGDRRDQPAAGQAGRLQRRAHGVDPQPLRKRIADITDLLAREDADTEELLGGPGRSAVPRQGAGARAVVRRSDTGGTRARARGAAGGRPGRPHPAAQRPDARGGRASCSSSWPPGCATRSASSRRSCAAWTRPASGDLGGARRARPRQAGRVAGRAVGEGDQSSSRSHVPRSAATARAARRPCRCTASPTASRPGGLATRRPSVLAPYMGARPWNKVLLDGSVADDDLLTLVDDSYDCVVAGLPRTDRPEGWLPPAPAAR